MPCKQASLSTQVLTRVRLQFYTFGQVISRGAGRRWRTRYTGKVDKAVFTQVLADAQVCYFGHQEVAVI